MKRALLLPLLLAGCGASTTPPPVTAAPVLAGPGLDRVLGQNAGGLLRLFGQPDADVREGPGRKLQFASGICVLDAYLYPKEGAEPRVTHLDTREPDGSAIDRASCIAALTRREGGK